MCIGYVKDPSNPETSRTTCPLPSQGVLRPAEPLDLNLLPSPSESRDSDPVSRPSALIKLGPRFECPLRHPHELRTLYRRFERPLTQAHHGETRRIGCAPQPVLRARAITRSERRKRLCRAQDLAVAAQLGVLPLEFLHPSAFIGHEPPRLAVSIAPCSSHARRVFTVHPILAAIETIPAPTASCAHAQMPSQPLLPAPRGNTPRFPPRPFLPAMRASRNAEGGSRGVPCVFFSVEGRSRRLPQRHLSHDRCLAFIKGLHRLADDCPD